MKVFKTESGSTYELKRDVIRRVNEEHPKPLDGLWRELSAPVYLTVGEGAIVLMEASDGGLVPDSFVTSRVTEVTEERKTR